MTFLVKRPHPGNSRSGLRIIRDLMRELPLPLEVEPAEPRTDYASCCKCTEVYRVTAEATSWLRKRRLLRDIDRRQCLCACMGNITE